MDQSCRYDVESVFKIFDKELSFLRNDLITQYRKLSIQKLFKRAAVFPVVPEYQVADVWLNMLGEGGQGFSLLEIFIHVLF